MLQAALCLVILTAACGSATVMERPRRHPSSENFFPYDNRPPVYSLNHYNFPPHNQPNDDSLDDDESYANNYPYDDSFDDDDLYAGNYPSDDKSDDDDSPYNDWFYYLINYFPNHPSDNPQPQPTPPPLPSTTTPPFYFEFFQTIASLPQYVYGNLMCNTLSSQGPEPIDDSGKPHLCGFPKFKTYKKYSKFVRQLSSSDGGKCRKRLMEQSLDDLELFVWRLFSGRRLPRDSPYRQIYDITRTFLMSKDDPEENQKKIFVDLLMSVQGQISVQTPQLCSGRQRKSVCRCPDVTEFRKTPESILTDALESSLTLWLESHDETNSQFQFPNALLESDDISSLNINLAEVVIIIIDLDRQRSLVGDFYNGLVRDSTFEDTEAGCYLLSLYASTTCGLTAMSEIAYSTYNCSVNTSQPLPAITTTSSTTTTTTTTPAPTTTTTTPSTSTTVTTAPRPTTTTTTTTTPVPTTTTTTTTPTTTTTTSTTTTTTPAPSQCGRSPTAARLTSARTSPFMVTSRIVGGTSTGTCATYPWQVRLNIDDQFLCGGSIIDATHILTAAHCIPESRTGTIEVIAGDYDLNVAEPTEQHIVTNVATDVAVHPNYATGSLGEELNDVAVITLPQALDLTKECAEPICLDPDFTPEPGQECTVTGWGKISESGPTADTLQSVSVNTFLGPDCVTNFSIPFSEYVAQPASQVCAGDPKGGKDSCGGDSGGPLVCLDPESNTFKQVGIVSYGSGCAQSQYPGIYASTNAYLNWIKTKL